MQRADMIGKRFGSLVVKGLSEKRSGKRKRLMWLCDCDCGNKDVSVIGEKLRSGHTQSCGCKKIQVASVRKKNTYDLSGDYGIGYTTKGEEFYFDKEDYNKIKDFTWFINAQGYVSTHLDKTKSIYLHRLVLGLNEFDNVIVDHKKHRKFDNRKSELRIGDKTLNSINKEVRIDNTSGVTGVYARGNSWCAEIMMYGEKVHLGQYKNIEDAIRARKSAEEEYFKDWSYDRSMRE